MLGAPAMVSRSLSCSFLAVAALAVFGTQAQSAQASTSFLESAASTTLPYPDSNNWYTDQTACGSADCASVGYYEDSNGYYESLVIPSASGVPAGGGAEVQLPSGADTSAPYSELNGVSCWSAGSCFAVGFYLDGSDNTQPLVVPITNGSVGTGIEVALPSGAATATDTQDAGLTSVSCSPTGACVAVGYYTDSSGNDEPLVVPINNGTIGNSAAGLLPSGAVTSGQDASLEDVSCVSSGACLAVGYFTPSSGTHLPMTESVTNGSPANVSSVSVPSNAYSGDDDTSLERVSCWADGACAAVGYYEDSSDDYELLAAPITNGLPGAGVELSLPAGADPAESSPALDDVACQSIGDCLGVGYYYDTSDIYYALDAPITNGVAGATASPSFPSDTTTNGDYSAFYDVSCPPSGACLGVGYYYNSSLEYQAMTVTFSGGTVGAGEASAAPSDESTTNPYTYLQTVGCGGSGSCVAAGEEENQSSDYVPYMVSAQAPLAVTTSTLSGGVVASSYTADLSATGAWGPYSWSVTSGSPPRGLSLDSQTGVISGTPTAVGTSTFTVQVTGTGSPVQTATEHLSLTVIAAKLRVVTKSATVRKNRFGLKLRCSGGACKGTAKLQIIETYTVKHGKKRVRKHRTVAIGSARFSLAAGKTHTYTVTMKAAGRKALGAKHRLTATVDATVDGVKETAGRLTLKAAAVKDKKKK